MKSVSASLLTIGDELLKGSVLNTNARYLSHELTALGFGVGRQTACRDQLSEIVEHIARDIERSDLVILSGGLGPTPDDVTREAIAEFCRVPLILSKSQLARIQKHYRRHGHAVVPAQVKQEAYYPKNAVPLTNRHGIALGFYLELGKKLMVVLPGVPRELEKMFDQLVRPLLKRRFRGISARPHLVIKIVGQSEPEIMQRLGRDFFKDSFDFGIYPDAGEVTLRLYADRQSILRRLHGIIKKRLGKFVYAYEDMSLTEAVGKLLTRRKKTLSVAESCTGGALSARIASVSGASRYFKGGITAYNNEIKKKMHISAGLLRKKGAVSEEVAASLANGIRQSMQTDFGIGVTGVAGPTGGSAKKPVGLVYIAVSTQAKTHVDRHLFWGDRHQIQIKAVHKSLEYLWQRIK